MIAGTAYTLPSGEAELEKGITSLIAYGTPFIANSDLPRSFELNAELNQADPSTFFGGSEKGYTDYPFLD
ncbi:MAG: hypothetical protein Q4A74_10005 [Cardiobacteriaceae bacterium]|nr:hypothetical protein [Cardiobacteriaceae bacterium]